MIFDVAATNSQPNKQRVEKKLRFRFLLVAAIALFGCFVCAISTWKFYYRSGTEEKIARAPTNNPSGRLNLFIYLCVSFHSWCLKILNQNLNIAAVNIHALSMISEWNWIATGFLTIRFQLLDECVSLCTLLHFSTFFLLRHFPSAIESR